MACIYFGFAAVWAGDCFAVLLILKALLGKIKWGHSESLKSVNAALCWSEIHLKLASAGRSEQNHVVRLLPSR